MQYIARKATSPSMETEGAEKRLLRFLLAPEIDPGNTDIALGITELPENGCSDRRGHPDGELFFCLKGKGTVEIEGEDHVLGEHDAVYVPHNAVHQLKADCGSEFHVLWALTPPLPKEPVITELLNAEK